MMLKFINASLVACVLFAAFVLYTLELQTRSAEREIGHLKNAIAEEHESVKLLKAEWSNLTRPERLQKLAEEHLGLKPITQMQVVSEGELATRIPAEPIVRLVEEGKDPIGDILKAME